MPKHVFKELYRPMTISVQHDIQPDGTASNSSAG
jgi:hypothetical protein